MTATDVIPEPPFDKNEAARRLGVTPSWLRDHRHEVPFVRMGRFRRYTQAHLDSYVARRTVDPDPLGRSDRSKAAYRAARAAIAGAPRRERAS